MTIKIDTMPVIKQQHSREIVNDSSSSTHADTQHDAPTEEKQSPSNKKEQLGSDTRNQVSPLLISEKNKKNVQEFDEGDHVYVWCQQGLYNHHGIVVKVNDDNSVIIADFTNERMQTSKASSAVSRSADSGTLFGFSKTTAPSSNNNDRPDGIRFLHESMETTKWRKVKYGASVVERATSAPGTCNTVFADSRGLVVARAHFLFINMQFLPSYHVLLSNCEAAATWCKTGKWKVQQVNSLLDFSIVTGLGGPATVMASQPLLWPVALPTMAALGGAAIFNSVSLRREWKRTTKSLNAAFEPFWQDWKNGPVRVLGAWQHEQQLEEQQQVPITRSDWKRMSNAAQDFDDTFWDEVSMPLTADHNNESSSSQEKKAPKRSSSVGLAPIPVRNTIHSRTA